MRTLLRNTLAIGALASLFVAPPLDATSASESNLAEAAMHSDRAAVGVLLKSGADVNIAQGDGMTALHWAAIKNDVDLAKMLIHAGANVKATTRLGGYTPLLMAAKDGSVAMMSTLLAAGADPNRATTNGTTALMLAAAAGNPDGVKALLARGAVVNAAEVKGETALMFAAARGRTDAVHALIDGGADVKLTTKVQDLTLPYTEPPPPEPGRVVLDPYAPQLGRAGGNYEDNLLVHGWGGLAALHFAARQGELETAKALIAAGADINQRSGGDDSTPLLLAIINGQFDLASFLVGRGADPGAEAENGVTPLYAVLNCQWAPVVEYPLPKAFEQQHTTYLELLTALLDKGADPNARVIKKVWYTGGLGGGGNDAGATPFLRAASASDVDAMRLLVAHGADAKVGTVRLPARAAGAHDPGQIAVIEGYVSPLPPVPSGGADSTPLMAALSSKKYAPSGMMPAVKYLVEEMHLDVNARDAGGNTPLHLAASHGDNEMILYLVSKGADPLAVNRRGLTTLDMANGPQQKIQPFPDTIALLAKMGAKNNHACVSC